MYIYRYIRERICKKINARYERKRIEVLKYIKSDLNSINSRWIKLYTHRKYLTQAEFEKFDEYFRYYERIKDID